MIPETWTAAEVAVVGLAKTGAAAARWLAAQGVPVYASDIGETEELKKTARTLRAENVFVELGRHDINRIARAAAVVVSPGIPPSAAPVAEARRRGTEILAELDLATRALTGTRLIVVTGTNGKTTTVALTGHILASAGLDSKVAGNIGVPLIEIAQPGRHPEWAVVEASSFQIHDSPNLTPTVGVLTNLSPDHLNRYGSVEQYYADKRLLFRNASDTSVWILNADDSEVLGLAEGVPGERRCWSVCRVADAWYDRDAQSLMLAGEVLLQRSALRLLGDHNIENALAAGLAAQAVGVPAAEISHALASFESLPHRLELVREVNGILWINDSKATNVASARVAVQAMQRPFVLIAGGRHKGESYRALANSLSDKCLGVIAVGEAAELIAAELSDSAVVESGQDLQDAIDRAQRLAERGSAVLLSPACASYDMFVNYEERGQVFRRLVEAL